MKTNKIILIIFTIFFVILLVNSAQTKIHKEVSDKFEYNNKVRIIIELKEPSMQKGIFIQTQKTYQEIKLEKRKIKEDIIKEIKKENVKHVFEKSIAIEITKDELERLEKNSNIESIKIDLPLKAFLQDSVPLINATKIWPIQINNFNITGIGETVCIIDTGTNFAHPDLVGKNKTCVIDCQSSNPPAHECIENCSVGDDNGHGTHVAGIIAANTEINGVSIGTNLIAIKSLDSNGDGFTSDIDAGIEWCTDNSELYNISVISMSLGADCSSYPESCFNNYCNGYSTSTPFINDAIAKNISVIIATGNDGNKTHISYPSCIENATAVGSSTKLDIVSSFSNRNNITDLFAPGSSINSTFAGGSCLSGCVCQGDYMSCSGTSMATPHVAGAFAIIRQFFRLQNNRVPTPSEIKILLNNTGKLIDDSSGSGYNFTRIDIYSALISIDSSSPNVNLISPEDNTFNFSQNITFRCSANDVELSNITFYLWNSTELYNTTFRDISGTNANVEFNLTNLPHEEYKWNCLAYDTKNNFSFASSNYSLTIDSINIVLNSPANNTFTKEQEQNFNCSAETILLKELSNITFYLWNSTELIYNITQNITGVSNETIFNYNLTNETSYYWNCQSYNNESNFGTASNNNTITYETISPNITLIEPLPASATLSSVSRIFYYNATDNYNINNCSLIINNTISLTNSSISSLLTNNFTQTFTPGTYNWQINCTDIAGNIGNSSSQSFVITAPIITPSGGRGGSPSIKTYTALAEQISEGYTKTLRKNDKIKFEIINKVTEQHTITTNHVGVDYVDLTVQSDPINFLLYIGGEKKLNLTSSEYYNLYIKLNSIKNKKANLTIQTIHEQIFQIPEIEILKNKTITGETIEEKEIEKPKIPKLEYLKTYLIIILIIFIIFILIIKKRKSAKIKKKNESTKTKRTRKKKVSSSRRKKS